VVKGQVVLCAVRTVSTPASHARLAASPAAGTVVVCQVGQWSHAQHGF